jgi:hypothetical protein
VKKRHLTAAQVAELAELFEDAPRRIGMIDPSVQAAAAGRGMSLLLGPVSVARGEAAVAGSDPVDSGHGHDRR